ncbi:hypothetical protein B0H17DRAFT_1046613 [Mycena rosella]|uniref:Uncharacterized protein n=1 Tax=Mycena rosella TaxID=1033263 RepID=A0AAD7DVK7_MYCRO|nr:hypothetical protein B0H17DRAFT_1046613 [Mycena rosella]
MPNKFELYGILISTAILTLFFISTHRCILPQRRAIHHTTQDGIRRLLDRPSASKTALLRSRASANARLVGAFHLTNTFVSPDPAIHSAFRLKSTALLQMAQRDWRDFTDVALQSVEFALPDRTTEFHTFVQAATLSTVIVGLLDPTANITALASTDVKAVADLITRIWILSKKPERIPTHLLQKLNDHLRQLMPDEDAYPNPLDFVITTWEVLWRVVGVTVAHVHADAVACEAFRDLNENPGFLQFRAARLARTSPSAEHYINEALRDVSTPFPGGSPPSPSYP